MAYIQTTDGHLHPLTSGVSVPGREFWTSLWHHGEERGSVREKCLNCHPNQEHIVRTPVRVPNPDYLIQSHFIDVCTLHLHLFLKEGSLWLFVFQDWLLGSITLIFCLPTLYTALNFILTWQVTLVGCSYIPSFP